MRAGKFFYQRFFLIFMALAVAAALTGCGKESADASSEYSVVLEGSDGQSPEDILQFLNRRVLRIEGRDGTHELDWSPRTRQMAQFEVGDDLVFNAYPNGQDRAVVTGRARVGSEKRISIILRRI